MALKNIRNRINRLEQKTARCCTEMPNSYSEWAKLVEQMPHEDLRELINYLKTKPFGAHDLEVQALADSSGLSPQDSAEVINEALGIQFEVINWQKTHSSGGEKANE